LVVYAHPSEKSLCARVLERVTADRDAVVVDLYRDGFSPVLAGEHFDRYGTGPIDDLVLKYQRQLREAKTATFVFPVWMYGLPAVLKGYFERVWEPEVSFTLRYGKPRGLLTGLERVNVACTFGQAKAFYDGTSDPIVLFFNQLMPQNCPRARFEYAPLFGLDDPAPGAVSAYLERVSTLLNAETVAR
jgi:putative NADPH-quinone reductase